jgi:hypothetical protein
LGQNHPKTALARIQISSGLGDVGRGMAELVLPLEANFVEEIDDVRFALLDESDLLLELGMIGKEGSQTVVLLRPIGPHLRAGICRFSRLLFGLFLPPILFASSVDLLDGIGEVDEEILVLACVAQHLQRFPFRVTVLAITGEDIVIGDHPFEEGRFHISIAAVMRHFQNIDLHLSARPQQSDLFQAKENLVTASFARAEHLLSTGFNEDTNAA